MKQMTPIQLQTYLLSGTQATLVDIREQHELQHGMLQDAIHIPMQSIPEKIAELGENKNKAIVLICRSGKRSDQVGQYLEQLGFGDVINLVGGMNAWAADIDSSMHVY
jgi:rhodanese-related sulfurtransferase